MASTRVGRSALLVGLVAVVLGAPSHGQDTAALGRLAAADSVAASGAWSNAEAMYSQVLADDASVIDAYLGLAHVQAAQGRVDAAVATYQSAIEQAPGDPVPRYNLAALLDAQGSRAALAAWSAYLAVAGADPRERAFVAKARVRLRRLQGP